MATSSRPLYLAMGADISPTHCACVVLSSQGEVFLVRYVAGTVKDAGFPGGTRLPACFEKMKEPGQRTTLRLLWMARWLSAVLLEVQGIGPAGTPIYLGLEDYAFHKPNSAHMVGEVGGVFRVLALYCPDIRLRLHDPVSLKLFATGRGDAAGKGPIAAAVEAKWNKDFSRCGKAAEDVTDAYVLARMALLEAQVRVGDVALADCREEELRVLNRVTDRYPVSVLGRDWIREEGGE